MRGCRKRPGNQALRRAVCESHFCCGPAALDYRLCEVALVAVAYEKKMAARSFARFYDGFGQDWRAVPGAESAYKAYDNLALNAERLTNPVAAASRSK
jgi:hypothetical protein